MSPRFYVAALLCRRALMSHALLSRALFAARFCRDTMEARIELVVVNGGAMTADRYIRDILEPHVVPFDPFIGNDFMLMHDNARPHIAQIVNEYLGTVEIHRII
jgi:hypothetical protein